MKLIREAIEDFQVICEKTQTGIKTYKIRGPFMQCETVNRNGRLYPYSVMEKAVSKYVNEHVNRNRAVGCLGHESTPKISEDKISHLITSLKFNGNDVIGEAKVLETNSGKELRALIEGGVSFGCSSRALGTLREGSNGIKIVQDDFMISAVDVVLDPSGLSCWVEGIMEGADWVYLDGVGWKQQYIEQSKKIIKKTNQKDLEEVALKIFENYIKRL